MQEMLSTGSTQHKANEVPGVHEDVKDIKQIVKDGRGRNGSFNSLRCLSNQWLLSGSRRLGSHPFAHAEEEDTSHLPVHSRSLYEVETTFARNLDTRSSVDGNIRRAKS